MKASRRLRVWNRWGALAPFVLSPLLAGVLASRAAEAARRPPGTVEAPALEEERRVLLGGNDEAAVAVAKKLGAKKTAGAVDVFLEVLATGTTPGVAEATLEALTPQGDERAWDTLALYAGHRNPSLRRQALRALAAIKAPALASKTSELLVSALGDADQDVRATAAESLAARGDRAGLGRMVALLRSSEPGVAEPLGTLATPTLMPEIAELVGSVNEEVLASTLGAALKRKDLAEPLRVDLVRTLAKITGPTSTAALADYVSSTPSKTDKAKKEAQAVLDLRSNNR